LVRAFPLRTVAVQFSAPFWPPARHLPVSISFFPFDDSGTGYAACADTSAVKAPPGGLGAPAGK